MLIYVCDHMKGLIKILVVKQVVEFYNASFDSVLSTDDINKLLRKRELNFKQNFLLEKGEENL